jgi:hypothetical protein
MIEVVEPKEEEGVKRIKQKDALLSTDQHVRRRTCSQMQLCFHSHDQPTRARFMRKREHLSRSLTQPNNNSDM